jgi:SNF2 family DNA or RNA helicase
MIQRGAAGLFLDPGLGKTSITLSAFEILKMKRYVDTLFVIAPLRVVHEVWPREIEKWEFELSYSIIHGSKKEEEFFAKTDIYLINYDGLAWLSEMMEHPKNRKRFGKMMLVFDESSKIKHTRTQRYKTLKPMLNWFTRRYILTGTPAPNGLMDLFGQIYAVDFGAALGRYITHFRLNYFQQTGYMGYDWVIRPGAEKEIYERLKPLVLRLDRSLLKLPKKTDVFIPIKIPKTARKLYTSMEIELLAKVQGHDVLAKNAAAASSKCRQIANGGIFLEDGSFRNIHDAKTEAALDIVDELGGKPVLIAYEFKHDLDRLLKAFGSKTPYIGGGVSTTQANKIITSWNAGKIHVLLVQPQSVAHGLNLQDASHNLIWYGLTWNLEDYEQTYQRLWRQGQKHAVMNYHLIAEDTIDEVMVKVLKGKHQTQKDLLKALEWRLAA